MKVRAALGCLAVLLVLLLPGVAGAQTSVDVPVAAPPSQTEPPPGFSTSARDAIAVAERTDEVREARREHGDLVATADVWDGRRWQVTYRAGDEFPVEVEVSAEGRVLDVWTGLQAASYFTRDLGETLGSPWIVLAFAVLFVAPFVDRRRPWRLLHLDLLALLAFLVPFALLSARESALATWAIYPPLVYLLARMLMIAAGRGRPRGPAVPGLPTAVLAVGLVVLVGARVGLNLEHDRVVDVGYASVVGADRVMHGEPLYVDNEAHGDTYGPLNYVAYVPFELAFPWTGAWDGLPAAHAAAIAFDLLTLLALFLLGCRLRAGPDGRRLGLGLAWAWAAFPLGLYSLMQNTNDGLVAMLAAWALLAIAHPVARGGLLGLAAAAKFFPAALIGVLWRGRGAVAAGPMAVTAGACAAVVALAVVAYLPPGGLREVWDCTLGFQLSRPADFSLWGLYPLRPLQLAVQGAAVALAVAAGFWPRGPRSLQQLAALAAAVLLALQLGAGHWFFFYVVWFAPFVLVAALGSHASRPQPAGAEVTARREREPALAAH